MHAHHVVGQDDVASPGVEGTVIGLATTTLIAVGVILWRLVGAGAEQATKAQIDEVMAELHRQSVLARELEMTRGTERQELRFESYGQLWAKMLPLAIYEKSPIDAEAMATMSKELTAWYFSDKGGLMLTSHNRDLYFALQDLVDLVGSKPDWQAERVREPKVAFEAVVGEERLDLAARTGADRVSRQGRDFGVAPERSRAAGNRLAQGSRRARRPLGRARRGRPFRRVAAGRQHAPHRPGERRREPPALTIAAPLLKAL